MYELCQTKDIICSVICQCFIKKLQIQNLKFFHLDIYHLDCLFQIIAGQWDPGAGTVTVTLQTGENAADVLTEFEASFFSQSLE